VAAGFSALVRADNLVFFAVLVGVVGLHGLRLGFIPGQRQRAIQLGRLCVLLPVGAAPLMLGWMTFNYYGLGEFRLTTIMGYQNTQAVYNLWDRVEPQDKVLGQIMHKFYQLTNSPSITETAFVWQANPEIQARVDEMPVTIKHPSMKQIDVGDYLGAVSRNLAERFPAIWLQNAASSLRESSFNFHYPLASPGVTDDPATVRGGNVIRREYLWRWEGWLDRIEAPVLLACFLATLGWGIIGSVRFIRAKAWVGLEDVAVSALALSTITTFIAFGLLEAFHNPYGEPHLGIMVVCTAYTLHWLRSCCLAAPKDAVSGR